jgi:RNA polymerase sigma-70 factor (ECF subfamily)
MAGFADISLDPSIALRLARGDRDALAIAYDRLAAPVMNLAARILGDRALAEEVLHDTFVDLMEQVRRIEDPRALVFWVRKVAVNHCLMRLRSPWHRRRHAEEPAEAADEANGPLRLGELRDLETALARLGAETRLVLWLHDVEGYTHQEIGALMGKTSSYSKSQLARGYQKLERMYGGQHDGSVDGAGIRPAHAT